MVCMATALKMEAAMSAVGSLRLTRFCMSVLAKTPQRDAMGYMRVKVAASSLIFLGSMSRSVAIWSMKAPVPPAQEPFMRMSGLLFLWKKTILASSPPKSMSVKSVRPVSFIAALAAKTSCTNGSPERSDNPMPAEPVTHTLYMASGPTAFSISSSWFSRHVRMSAKWRLYELKATSPVFWSITTNLMVVEPASMPML